MCDQPIQISGKKRTYLLLTLLVLLIAGLLFLTQNYLTIENSRRLASVLGKGAGVSLPVIAVAIIATQIMGMALSLPSKAVVTILAGALLGPIWGVIVTFIGVLTGTSVLFFVARKLLRKKAIHKAGRLAAKLDDRLTRRPMLSMAGMRLMITLPYGPITIAAALTGIRYRDFLAGSLIGDFPVVVMYCLAGARLALLTDASQALSASTVIILIVAGAALILGSVFSKKQER